jgi:hypothetical protein
VISFCSWNCLTCAYNNPVISDFSAGEIPARDNTDEFAEVDEFAAGSATAGVGYTTSSSTASVGSNYTTS